MDTIVEANTSYPFDDIKIKTPKALQGGTYSAKLELNNEPIVIQTPKCKTKNGIHTTVKQIYCDLLMNQDHNDFIKWLRLLQERVRKLILENSENWFHEPPTMDEIEYNWNDSIRTYKSVNYLIRTFIHKAKSINKISLQIYDSDENELSHKELDSGKSIIGIIEIVGLKFSSNSFHLEICLRQVMVLKEKPLFGKCLIKLGGTNNTEKINIKTKAKKQTTKIHNLVDTSEDDTDTLEELNEITDNLDEIDDVQDQETQQAQEIEEPVDTINSSVTTNEKDALTSEEESSESNNKIQEISETKKINNDLSHDSEDVEEEKKIDIEKQDNTKNTEKIESSENLEEMENPTINSLEPSDKLENLEETITVFQKNSENQDGLEEISLEIDETSPLTLKNPNEVYLDIYKAAREKAKKAKNEAIKAYLEAKRIKELYLLDVVDTSDEESDEYDDEEELFSEK